MGRAPCCDNVGLKKGPWTADEDQKLLAYIKEHGHGSWRSLPAKAGLLRCGKSCRLRWTNYLRPDIKRGKFSLQEEQIIIQFHALLGNRWSAIATNLPQRTDNEIKNYWNTHLKKRLAKMGIDPVTHKRKCDSLIIPDGQQSNSSASADLSHMAQWESARLEAEARLARESNLRRKGLPVPLTNSALISPEAFANREKLPSAPRPCPSFYSSIGSHLDMMKLKALLLRTKRPSNSSCAVGHMRTEDWQQTFALTDSLADSPTSTLTYSELNIFPDKKPPQEELVGGSMIANDFQSSSHEELCLVDDYLLPLPNLHDMVFTSSSSALSFSEERSAPELSEAEGAKDEISSSGGFSAHDHDAFVTDLLLDLSSSENDHMIFMSDAESRDYWSSILNMVSSPQPHNSSVQALCKSSYHHNYDE